MEAEYRAAVDWWCNALRGKARDDNGEVLHSAFKTAVKDTLPALAEDQIRAFGSELSATLHNPEVAGYLKRMLSCDYHPSELLAHAADSAGIDDPLLRFPWKTVMWIEPGRVTVQNGYGAEVEVIYPAQEGGA